MGGRRRRGMKGKRSMTIRRKPRGWRAGEVRTEKRRSREKKSKRNGQMVG